MNILHIIPNLGKGGAERLCLDICSELQAQNHNVLIVILEDINEYQGAYDHLQVKYIPVTYNLSIKGSNIDISKLEELVTSFAPDYIHSHLYYADLITLELKFKNHIIHIHSKLRMLKKFSLKELSLKKLGLLNEQLKIRSLIKANKPLFLTVANDTQNYMLNHVANLKPKGVQRLYNCVDLKRFNDTGRRIQNEEVIKLVNIGRLVEYKGHDLLLQICVELRNMGVNFSLDIFGMGPKKDWIINKIKELELTNNVYVKGGTLTPEDEYKKADIYLHTSTEESFGLVFLEAMACGTPVVTTDGLGNRDIIEHNNNGLFFYDRDSKKIATSIAELFQNKNAYNNIRINGLKFCQDYSIESYVDKLNDIYANW